MIGLKRIATCSSRHISTHACAIRSMQSPGSSWVRAFLPQVLPFYEAFLEWAMPLIDNRGMDAVSLSPRIMGHGLKPTHAGVLSRAVGAVGQWHPKSIAAPTPAVLSSRHSHLLALRRKHTQWGIRQHGRPTAASMPSVNTAKHGTCRNSYRLHSPPCNDPLRS